MNRQVNQHSMPGLDYYRVLGVEQDASVAEIKSAYRVLAKTMHPDAGGTAGTFQVLRDAYETLSDPVRRDAYDRRRQRISTPTPPPRTRWQPASRRSTRTRTTSRRTTTTTRVFGDDPHFTPTLPRLNPEKIPWWNLIDTRPRSGGQSPGHAPHLSVVGGIGVFVVTLLVPGLWSPVWLALIIAIAVLITWLTLYHLRAARHHRELTAEFGDKEVFGRPGEDRDQIGERLTAELISRYFTKLPGTRTFHSLAFPDSVFADVDHAVLTGNRLVLVESKLWPPGHYTTTDDGELLRNGGRFRGGSSKLAEAIAAYQRLLPKVEVRGAIVIYPNRAGTVTTAAPRKGRGKRAAGAGISTGTLTPVPMTPKQFVLTIGDWLATQPSTVDTSSLRTMLNQVVSR